MTDFSKPQMWKLYRDEMYGYEAASKTKNMAWMLIRNKCYEMKKEVPTFDKIIEVRELQQHELETLKLH